MIKIWYRKEGCKPECIDECAENEASMMLYNYQMSYACLLPRHHRYGKDNVWVGRMKDEPPLQKKEGYY